MEYEEAEEYYYGEEATGNGTEEACERQADWEASFWLLTLLYLLVFALRLSGNGLVLLTVWHGPRARRRSAGAYIGDLALADLAFVATLPLWAAYTALRFYRPFGAALCKASSFPVLLSVFASAFRLGGLSAHRCRPAAPRRRYPAGPGLLAALWAAAVPLQLREARRGPRNRTPCELAAGRPAALSLGATALGFAAPLLPMAGCCCCRLAAAVRRYLRPRRAEAAGGAGGRLRRLPFHLLKSLFAPAAAGLLELPCALLGPIARLHPCAACLAYLNSCLNPLLYAFLDGRFRDRCRLLLGRAARRLLRARRPRAALRGALGRHQAAAPAPPCNKHPFRRRSRLTSSSSSARRGRAGRPPAGSLGLAPPKTSLVPPAEAAGPALGPPCGAGPGRCSPRGSGRDCRFASPGGDATPPPPGLSLPPSPPPPGDVPPLRRRLPAAKGLSNSRCHLSKPLLSRSSRQHPLCSGLRGPDNLRAATQLLSSQTEAP